MVIHRGPHFHEVTLRSMEFNIKRRLDHIGMPNARFEVDHYLDHTCTDIVLHLRAFIYGEPLESKRVRYPKDWWQALKLAHAPKWFLDRCPVQYEVVEIHASAFYPQVSAPDRAPVVRLIKWEG